MWPTTKLRLTAFRFIRFVSVPATECMRRMPFLWLLHAGFYLLICCVQALQHQQASSAFSLGSGFPISGKLPVSPSRIHDKHKHLYPRRSFRAFLFCFFRVREIIKKRACISSYALETWDHGLNGSSKHYFHNCSLFFFLLLFSCTEVSACCFFYRHAVNSGWLC